MEGGAGRRQERKGTGEREGGLANWRDGGNGEDEETDLRKGGVH